MLQVSVSGFYEWLRREPSPRAQANAAVVGRIQVVHERSRQTYGYLRVHAELRAARERVGKHQVARLMAQMGLVTKWRRRFKATTPRATRPAPISSSDSTSAISRSRSNA